MLDLLKHIHLEWWHLAIVLLVSRIGPLIKAVAAILLGRFVSPDLAKIALPLVLSPKKVWPLTPKMKLGEAKKN